MKKTKDKVKQVEPPKIIGVGGTNGSGKDTVGQMLAERHGWLFVSVTDILRDELKKRGLPPARQHMRELSTEWHKKYSAGILTDLAVKKFKKAGSNKYKGLVLASIRRPGEANRLHELGGKLVWVDADPKVRYERIQANLHSRGELRAVDDRKTFEEFMTDEKTEMHGESHSHSLNMNAVKAKADIFISNDGDDIEAFKDAAEKALGLT